MCEVTRRRLLLSMLAYPVLTACHSVQPGDRLTSAENALKALERRQGGRLGVSLLDTGSGVRLNYRADERFAMCSTFKLLLVSCILRRAAQEQTLLARRIRFTAQNLTNYNPVTGRHVQDGMTVRELCDAAMRYSDNTAANLLLGMVGGPRGLTAYIRTLGDRRSRLDRMEPDLNTAIEGDERDTTTPAAMLLDMQSILLGEALPAAQRALLEQWMRSNTTGDRRIRAALPQGWRAGDKTGTGDNGAAGDIAILRPLARPPVLLAIYYAAGQGKPFEHCNDTIAMAARIAMTVIA